MKVAHTAYNDYECSLYAQLRPLADPMCLGHGMGADLDLKGLDILHVGFPEHFFRYDQDLDSCRRFLARLRFRGTRLVLTAHNRRPHHWPSEAGTALYRLWYAQADAVIHLSNWGQSVTRDTYATRVGCLHAVIPHGHFGHYMPPDLTQAIAVRRLELPAAGLRLGLLGRWTPGKRVEAVLRAFRACARPDVRLLLTALPAEPSLYDDPRIDAPGAGGMWSRDEVCVQIAACDALIAAHDPQQYLASGIPADAIGSHLPLICGGWEYFFESIGPRTVIFHDEHDLTALLGGLDGIGLHHRGRAILEANQMLSWRQIAAQTLDLYQRVMDRRQPA